MISKNYDTFKKAFGTDDIDPHNDVWFQFTHIGGEGVFLAECSGRRYVASGMFEDMDTYRVIHGPTKLDMDVIAALLAEGVSPTEYE